MFGESHTAEEAQHGQRTMWRKAVVTCCPVTNDIVVEYFDKGVVVRTKRLGPTEFAHQGKHIAWSMGQHVTP